MLQVSPLNIHLDDNMNVLRLEERSGFFNRIHELFELVYSPPVALKSVGEEIAAEIRKCLLGRDVYSGSFIGKVNRHDPARIWQISESYGNNSRILLYGVYYDINQPPEKLSRFRLENRMPKLNLEIKLRRMGIISSL